MTTFLAVLGVNRRLSSLMQLLLPLFFITLMTCALAFSGGVQSSQTVFLVLHDNFGSNSSTSGLCEPTPLQDSQRTCTKLDISLHQGQEGTVGGIPTFGVEITNVCTGGCPISDVHVACGDFASAMLVNPAVFRRLSLNDCLVNNGNPISNGDMIRFEYDNSFMYPMHVLSAVTCHWTS
ncbi:hypothetical protein CY35_13G049800 [Sphagnum magellanicum]|nr:hypothetical protein CY35_13G049800 [Sphagnum magellanicum]